MVDIIRNPTPEETDISNPTMDGNTRGFIPIGYKNQPKTPKEKFELKLCEEEQIALKKGLPFAANVARDDFDEFYRDRNARLKRKGYLDKNDPTEPTIDWKKYSDLKNFELTEETEVADSHLSKVNPGLNVLVKTKRYKFKGYQFVYSIMESGPDAIVRARNKLRELDKK